MTLISRIKQLAQSKQLTLAQLERNVGISNGQIRRWDTSSPKVENLLKIADYFSVSLDYLMGRTQQTEINHQAPITNTQKELHIQITTEDLTEEEITQLEEEANRFLRFRKFEMTNP